MIVYLKYYDSGCKYIWAYIIYYSYKPSIKMLNSSPQCLFPSKHNNTFSISLKVFKAF